MYYHHSEIISERWSKIPPFQWTIKKPDLRLSCCYILLRKELLRKEDIAMSIDKFFFSLFWAHTKYPLILRTSKLAENRQKKWRIFQCQELSWHKRMSMLWFNFILGSNFIFHCFKLVIIHYNKQKQKKTKFEPRIKSNHNIYINHLAAWKNLQFCLNCPTSPTSFDVFVHQTDFTIAVTWIQLRNLAAIIKVWFYMTWWGIENKGNNIMWWSLALSFFSWDRSLLVTKSWYSRSCFSGRSRGVGWVGFRSLSIRSYKFLKESFLKCGITYYFLTNIFTWPESFLCLYMLGSNIKKSSF